jgi:phosphoheptose isomerase
MSRETVSAALHELSYLATTVAQTMSSDIDRAAQLVTTRLLAGGKVLACGNGGSAADAQHFVAELVGHMRYDRVALPAIALTSDPSVVTSLSNDYGYEYVFARQVEAWGQRGDVLVAISTSGRSPNVLHAFERARQQGLHTIALLGPGGLDVFEQSSVCLHVPSPNTQRVQELHTAMLHAICEQVERQLIEQ